jgi:hypothetical protein
LVRTLFSEVKIRELDTSSTLYEAVAQPRRNDSARVKTARKTRL